MVPRSKHFTLYAGILAGVLTIGAPAVRGEPAKVHLVHMGGNDCPPCVTWRQIELPKLEASVVFRSIQFSYVVKSIKSSMPAEFFLPDDVKSLKEKLDIASGRARGCPLWIDQDRGGGGLPGPKLPASISAVAFLKNFVAIFFGPPK